MITPSFSLTATERVLPRLALDFTTASLDSRITFTRALNTATRVNSSGLVEIVNADLPRFDYNPVTLACKGLLIEESRVNSVTYSEDFFNAAWGKTGSSVTSNAVAAPDGNTTADKLIGNNGEAGRKAVSNSISTTSGVTYTLSVFLKKGEKSTATISFATANVSQGAFYGSNVLLDLNAGTSANPSIVSLTNYGNGWYRAAVTGTMTASEANTYFLITLGAVNGGDFTGNGTDGIYIWGAQIEVGAFPTSYIPNVATGTTTRNADVATMTGTNFSDWYSQTEGAVVAIGTGAKGQFPMAFGITETTANIDNQYCCFINNGTTPIQDIWSGGVPQVSLNSGAVITLNGRFAIASAVKTNNFAGCAVAGTVQTDNLGTLPSVMTRLNLGSRNDVLQLNGWLEKFMYFPQRITNAEVQAFSK